MARRPRFDPTRVRRPAPLFPTDEGTAPLTPRALNELVAGALRAHLPATVHVLGEIGEWRRAGSGHVYFSLKDADSEVRAILWRSAAEKLRFALESGLEVIATGGLEVYTPRGTYQLIVRRLEPRGTGALELAFRQLRERLAAEGLFDAARKRPMPRCPARIAVVTSPSGAAIRDVVQTIRRRFPVVELVVFPVRVQGEGAAREIAEAIRLLNTRSESIGAFDVAIVGRGGGSLEDLWAFNEEVVARAIAASAVPIVSGVGHETDTTISDLVADVRAATPTAAAEIVTPDVAELLARLRGAAGQARRAASHRVALARNRLTALLAFDAFARPMTGVRERAQRLDEAMSCLREAWRRRAESITRRTSRAHLAVLRFAGGAAFARLARRLDALAFAARRGLADGLHARERRLDRLGRRVRAARPDSTVARCDERLRGLPRRLRRAATAVLAARRERLERVMDGIRALHPARALQRGYSITRDARSGRILRSIQEVREGQRVRVELADGEFRASAEDPRQPRLFDE